MTSKLWTQDNSLGQVPESELLVSETIKSKRQATVYDAVAGRVSATGFIPDIPVIAASRDTASSSSAAVPPEAVLFRRKNAPTRFEESDFYFASDSLPPQALPDSDLLKALHSYTSDFYSHATADGGGGDWRSMDETAMLAMGILMEEICREMLGETGDLVFTEGDSIGEHTHRSSYPGEGQSAVSTSQAAVKSGKTRTGKRRRLNIETTTN